MSLIKNVETDVAPFVDIDQDLTLKSIKPDIDDKEEKELLPILGPTLYAHLHNEYNATTPDLTDLETELLRLSQKVIVNFAFADAIDSLQLGINDSGITSIESSQEKRPYKYQIENFRSNCLKRAYSGVESLLQFLLDNTAVFTEWQDSEYSNSSNQYFINSAIEFQKFEDIKKNLSTFEALKTLMKDVEKISISTTLGEVFMSSLKTKLKGGTLSTQETFLLEEYIRPAIAKLTIADACDSLAVEIKGNGIVINQLKQDGTEQLAADDARIQRKRTFAQRTGEYYLNKMREYVNETATESVFELYFTSSLYIAPTAETEPLETRNIYRA